MILIFQHNLSRQEQKSRRLNNTILYFVPQINDISSMLLLLLFSISILTIASLVEMNKSDRKKLFMLLAMIWWSCVGVWFAMMYLVIYVSYCFD